MFVVLPICDSTNKSEIYEEITDDLRQDFNRGSIIWKMVDHFIVIRLN